MFENVPVVVLISFSSLSAVAREMICASYAETTESVVFAVTSASCSSLICQSGRNTRSQSSGGADPNFERKAHS